MVNGVYLSRHPEMILFLISAGPQEYGWKPYMNLPTLCFFHINSRRTSCRSYLQMLDRRGWHYRFVRATFDRRPEVAYVSDTIGSYATHAGQCGLGSANEKTMNLTIYSHISLFNSIDSDSSGNPSSLGSTARYQDVLIAVA
ncbi:hypothetical protein EVAR_50321_1 [Eumeta japonica]|uniref:Uncharacterized protein n=1 Tax=Eumeta variegata TaxID=151549 RepID=A0A4C1XRH3_EUMVA|nr:hypothetical protein EVAR_50321_1 [Eumeta japonica]